MSKWFKKAALIVGLSFFALFLFRLIYGYLVYPSAPSPQGAMNLSSFQLSRNNYASAKLRIQGGTALQGINVYQKYEKIASLNAESKSFDRDEKALRQIISTYNGLIQYEENTGLKGSRQLLMGIGVHPSRFDSFVRDIRNVGKIRSIEINKYDKTNEFKDLLAKKSSLETTRDALLALKNKGGKIEEFVQLENRLLDIEEQIQGLGIKLGEFDAENEFCTVKFGLVENAHSGKIPLIQRILVALEWTIKYYLMLAAILFFVSLLTLILFVIVEKIRALIPRIDSSLRETPH